MASEVRHKDQYKHNIDFLNNGIKNSEQYKDWVITASFYSAVHLVELLLAREGHHTGEGDKSASHSHRRELMKLYLKCYNEIKADYEMLEQLSRIARYGCANCTGKDVLDAQCCLDTIKGFVKL